MSEDRNNNIGWFLAGLGLGAVVGILYAPKPGSETRQALLDSAGEGREFVIARSRQAREQVGTYVERGKEVVTRQKDQVTSAIEAGRQAYREATTPDKG